MTEPIKKTRILIVDDDSFLLGMYAMKFEKGGFETRVAANGEEAIDIIKTGYNADVLIMDLIMPIMDGFAVYESLRNEKLIGNTMVVLLTNQSTAEDINRAKELGIDGFIVKATTIPSEVVEKVKNLLANR